MKMSISFLFFGIMLSASPQEEPRFNVERAWAMFANDDFLMMAVGLREVPKSVEEYKNLVCELRDTRVFGRNVKRAKPKDYCYVRMNFYLGLHPLEEQVPSSDGPVVALGFYAQNCEDKGMLSIFWLRESHLKRPEDYFFYPDDTCTQEALPAEDPRRDEGH